ncbi:DUF4236 domain-containing protein [Cyanobium sp. ATX 6A2]|uniref:DUF4236 domain-containing protein n=1 Tax=Cyanobium sp. ATX 6A2 TaxID=2823700 RepID=UPI0020CCBEB9|nr:DUF4236 domain-containing protein [Cyanobium sp. ATX 6A2]MCP9887836.1 DUF4236 domain-containing protein [Cyanobium sp. ATX 6A2]
MSFRFRRSARLGPLRFNFAKSGLSSISVGGRGASFNIPVARPGLARTTVGIPGTGLSCSVEAPAGAAAGLPNSRRLLPGQLEAFRSSVLGVLQTKVFGPGTPGQRLWEQGLVSRLLVDGSLGGRLAGLLAVIETPEAMADYISRARSQDDAKRRARRCIEAAEEASRLAVGRGWLG